MAAFALVPVLAATGLSIDVARMYTVRSALSAAVDTAALAAAHERTEAERLAAFNSYFDANFPQNHLGAHVTETRLSYDAVTRRMTGWASARVDTTLMQLVGAGSVDVTTSTVIQSELRGMELVLVMDNTGSMRGGDSIGRMKDAARGLINALFDGRFDTVNRYDDALVASGRDELSNLWVSLVPYAASVNIGRGQGDQVWNGSSWEGGDEHFAWLNPVDVVDGVETANPAGTSPDAFFQSSYRVEHATNTPLCERDETGACQTDEDGDIIYQTVGGDPRGWLGCVMARADGLDQTDDPPVDSTTRFTPLLWHSDANSEPPNIPTMSGNANWYSAADDSWDENFWNSWPESFALSYTEADTQNSSRGPNLGCPPAITPLTANYTEIMDAIDEMAPWHRGGTWSNTGMVWGWRMLSPRWRAHWGIDEIYREQTLPLDYGTPGIEKVVVVLTDGTNQWYQDDFTAFGFLSEGRSTAEGGLNGTTSNSTATAEANSRMVTICDRMRRGTGTGADPALGTDDPDRITIYTIVLKASGQASTFESCASDEDKYFFASDNGELSGIFERISEDLSRIRIVQ
ncbi:MAG: hypothetical protein GVY13_07275 [Alphaproteobacteria bacterium]|jgi:Flp pilus assembly protein TadG|nr:hypothetical protein [Alphaproteobacteria bacterium]